MTARHVLHFGSPETVLNVFDLAASLLAPGGRFTAINFTAYVEFIYKYDGGVTLNKIIAENKRYRNGDAPVPGGYLAASNPFGLTLAELMSQPAFNDRDYFCFDDDTLHGLFSTWVKTRKERGLQVDLEIEASYLFSPTRIARHNSMTAPQFYDKENHYFELRKLP